MFCAFPMSYLIAFACFLSREQTDGFVVTRNFSSANVRQRRKHIKHEATPEFSTSPSKEHAPVTPDMLLSEAPPGLSVVLPAYNEKKRIEDTIVRYSTYLSQSPIWGQAVASGAGGSEIIVVDDGSDDGTAGFVSELAATLSSVQYHSRTACADEDGLDSGTGNSSNVTNGKAASHRKHKIHNSGSKAKAVINNAVKIRCVSLPQNLGKGAAIARGVAAASGDCSIVLVADADGSGDIACLDAMALALAKAVIIEKEMQIQFDVAGERSASNNFTSSNMLYLWERQALVAGRRISTGEKSVLRSILRWGFRTCVRLIVGDLVNDTQCGFKLLTISAAKRLYPALHLRGWAHDVELLFIARELGFPIVEADVGWIDKEGSKLVASPRDAFGASLFMLRDVAQMRLEYFVGNWNVEDG